MTLEGFSPGIIATIAVILFVAVVLVILYFVCRSDDPARDHTCVALLYPQSRRELRQLKIPLDPINSTNEQENQGYEEDKADKNDTEETSHHKVQIHNASQREDMNSSIDENQNESQKGFVELSLETLRST